MDLNRLRKQLKRHEGYSATLYYLNGIAHIGYGRNLEGLGIRESEAEFMLSQDIQEAVDDCVAVIKEFVKLSHLRQEALVNMMFNMGKPRFRTFKKMIGAIEHSDFKQAAIEMLDSRYGRQLPDRVGELAYQLEYDEVWGD